MNFTDYELKGKYVTAARMVPMHLGVMQKNGTWKVQHKPYDTLHQGKTFPHRIGGVTTVDGYKFAFTTPIKGASGLTSATFFSLTDESDPPFQNVSSDVLGKGTQYGKESGKYEMSWIKKAVIAVGVGLAVTYLLGVVLKTKLKAV